MLAMQYSILLSSDAGGTRIRKHVVNRAPLFDRLSNLAHKSFLLSAGDRLYAPFYVWPNDEAAQWFLLSDLFKRMVDAFGRPRVRTWSVLYFDRGDGDVRPRYALRELDSLDTDRPLAALAKGEEAIHRTALGRPGLYAHLAAFDPDRWEVMRFSLWRDEPCAVSGGADCVQGYEVLHLSEPADTGPGDAG